MKKVGTTRVLKTAARSGGKLMPLHQRIATGLKPVRKPERSQVVKRTR